MSINETLFADLTIIKGIGPARQQWLRQSFGVRTYADLAELLPDDIEAMLKADGQIARRSAVEGWVAQAQALSGTDTVRPLLKLPTDEFADWHPFASFVVEIQAREEDGRTAATRTAVQHIERDKNATWPGIEREKLCNWIVAQVDEEVQYMTPPTPASPPEPPPTVAISTAPSLSLLQIKKLEVKQGPDTSLVYCPERPLPIILYAERPFSFTLTLQLDPPLPNDTEVIIETRVYGRALHRGEAFFKNAVTTFAVHSGVGQLIQELGELTLAVGQYQFELTAVWQDSHTPPSHLTLPLLHVIE